MQRKKALSQMKSRLKLVSPDSTTMRRCTAKGATMYIGVVESMKLRRRAFHRNWIGWAITFVRREVDWLSLSVISLIIAVVWYLTHIDSI